jgi:predicted transcriptional regulator
VFVEVKPFICEPARIETYMCGLKIDPSKTGLRKTLREYEELALRFIWENGEEGTTSAPTWRTVNERLEEGKTISRASIIFFLNRMVDQGVLSWRDATGKGGHHRIYVTNLDEVEYRKYILRTVVKSMMTDFPEQTKEVLREFHT